VDRLKKVVAAGIGGAFLFLWLSAVSSPSYAQPGIKSIIFHATDCTAATAKKGIFCFEADANTLYVCEPSAGDCDTAGEWQLIGPGGAVAFSALSGGTNTTAAMVVGSGGSLALSGTGTIRASSIDRDGDGTREILGDGTSLSFDPADSGTPPMAMTATELQVCLSSASCSIRIGHSNRFRIENDSGTALRLVSRNTSGGGLQVGSEQSTFTQTWRLGTNTGGGGTALWAYNNGTAGAPEYSWNADSDIGMYRAGADDLRLSGGNDSALGVTPTEVDLYNIVDHGEQAVTCTDSGNGSPGALTITPSTSYVEITNSDADGCTITLSETGAAKGRTVEIVVVSTAGGTVNFADTSGVTELAGAFAAGIYDSIILRYIADRWIESTRSDN
jgi:hypothetical protein